MNNFNTSFDSISQACFLIKPPKATQNQGSSKVPSTNKKRKRKAAPEPIVTYPSKRTLKDVFQRLENGRESEQVVDMRIQLYEDAWQRMRSRIDDILRDINVKTLCEIDTFVQGISSLPRETDSEIPTGLIFAGINVSDHNSLFDQMGNMLRDSDPQIKIASLQIKDCVSLKATLKNMIEMFIYTEDRIKVDLENENEDSLDSFNIPKGHSRLSSSDMSLLYGWYRHMSNDLKNPKKLVVILQDFERIDSQITQDFIQILAEYGDRIPFVLLIGVATSFEIIHQSLSTDVISLMAVESFYVQPANQSFNTIIKDAFLHPTDILHYGPRTFKFLNDNFFLHNFSIETLASVLQYTHMHHFYGSPQSIFTVSDPNDLHEIKPLLASFHYELLRMQTSFREYCERICEENPQRVRVLLTDDDEIFDTLEEAMHDMKQYQRDFAITFDIMMILIDALPERQSLPKKTRRQLHFMSLEEDLCGMSYMQDIVLAIKTFHYKSSEKLLHGVIELLTKNPIGQFLSDFHRLSEDFQNLDGNAIQEIENVLHSEVKSLFGRTSNWSIKEVNTAAVDSLNEINQQLSKLLHDIFNKYLTCHTRMLFHEIVYYNSVRLHRSTFHPQSRGAIQIALGQPHHYLNCECCEPVTDENEGKKEEIYTLMASNPDTSILYRLYLECGRLINLYDWYTAFSLILQSEHREGINKKERRKIDEREIQARFVKSVAEMQFLGFIKPTKRKTDHVEKLVWSNI